MGEIFSRMQKRFSAVPRKRMAIGASVIAVITLVALFTFYVPLRESYSPPAQALVLYYDDVMSVTGFTITPDRSVRGGEKVNIQLEWRAQKNIHERYVTQVQIVDTRGHLWAEHMGEPGNGRSRTDGWTSGQRVLDLHTLELPSTMPTGNYKITLAVYNPDVEWNLPVRDAAGRMVFDQPVIADIQIQKDKSKVEEKRLLIQERLYVEMGDLDFLGYIPHPISRIARGEPFHLGVYWRAHNKPGGDYTVAVQFRDKTGSLIYEHAMRPAMNTYPTALWDEGEVLLDWHDFPIPLSFNAGSFQVFVVLRDANTQQLQGEVKIMNLSVTR